MTSNTEHPLAVCAHYRSTIRHDTCAAGVRYADIVGEEMTSFGPAR